MQLAATIALIASPLVNFPPFQVERLAHAYVQLLERHRLPIFAAYIRRFSGIPSLEITPQDEGLTHTYFCERCGKSTGTLEDIEVKGKVFWWCKKCRMGAKRCAVWYVPNFFKKKKVYKKKGAPFAKMNVLSGGQSKDDQGPLDGVQTVWAWRSSSVYAALSQYVPVAFTIFYPRLNKLTAIARSSASHSHSVGKRFCFTRFAYPAHSSQYIFLGIQPKRRLQLYHAFFYCRGHKYRFGGKSRWGRGGRE